MARANTAATCTGAVWSLTVAGDPHRIGADTVRSYEADHREEQASTKKHMYALLCFRFATQQMAKCNAC